MEPPQNFTAACEVSSQNDARYIWYKHPLIKKTKNKTLLGVSERKVIFECTVDSAKSSKVVYNDGFDFFFGCAAH